MASPYRYLADYQIHQFYRIAEMDPFDYSKELNENLEYVDRGIWQRRLISFLTCGALAPYYAFSPEKHVLSASDTLQRCLISAVYCEAFTTNSKFRIACEKTVQKFNEYIDRLNMVRADHNQEKLSLNLKLHIPTPKPEELDSFKPISDSELHNKDDLIEFGGGFEDELDSASQNQDYKESPASELEAHIQTLPQSFIDLLPFEAISTLDVPKTRASPKKRSTFIPLPRTYKRHPITNNDPMNMNLRPGVDIRVRSAIAILMRNRAI